MRPRVDLPWSRLRAAWPASPVASALLTAAVFVIASALMLPARGHLNVLNISLIYLMLIVLIALFADRWSSAAAAVMAFLLFDVLFIEPHYTLTIARADHVLALFVFLGIAVVVSQLIYQVRQRTLEALRHGRRMETLYELSQALIADIDLDSLLAGIVERVVSVFGVRSCAMVMLDDHRPVIRASHGLAPDLADPDEQALLLWAVEQRQPAGVGSTAGRVLAPRGTRTPGRAPLRLRQRRQPVLYVPIAVAGRTLGVLRLADPIGGTGFSSDDRQLLATFANQAALAIERIRLGDEATKAAVLARSDELKSALLSAVSHDLRTPLASIKASATSLLQDDVHWTKEDERDLLQAIDEESDRLARIVGNLLDLSRIEGGVLRPQRDWNEVAEVVADAAGRLRPTLPDREIRVTVEPDLPPVRFDYVEIGQVLVNLLENAAKYSSPGQPIDVSAARAGQMVVISVADRGRGIPPGEEERIFDKFYRLENRRGVSGAGIGLSICKGIAEAHGGRIWVEQRDGGGSVFRFTLPIEPHETKDRD
jgi:two-component system sensor histidine kinase KdpD